jgi:ABC-type lipoprotein release transport system permease subunit
LLAYAVGPLIFEGTTVAYVPQYFPFALVVAIAVAIIATIYPAFRATNIKVADSFRSL